MVNTPLLARPLQLGALRLRSSALLAPLEGVSDVAFRRVAHHEGDLAFTWTEMVRAAGLAGRPNAATLDLLDTFDPTTPTGVQLLAKRPSELVAALSALDALAAGGRGLGGVDGGGGGGAHAHVRHVLAVDLNLGCPSAAVLREGAGPALLRRRRRVAELFDVLVAWRDRHRPPTQRGDGDHVGHDRRCDAGDDRDPGDDGGGAASPLRVGAVGAKIRLGRNAREAHTQRVFLPVVAAARAAGLDSDAIHSAHMTFTSSC